MIAPHALWYGPAYESGHTTRAAENLRQIADRVAVIAIPGFRRAVPRGDKCGTREGQQPRGTCDVWAGNTFRLGGRAAGVYRTNAGYSEGK